jgi:hypothetical protein
MTSYPGRDTAAAHAVATAFAAHLAALARAPEPDDRVVSRVLGDVVQDWTALAASATPTFELDGATLWVGTTAVALPSSWRDALAPLEAALRSHGVGGVQIGAPVDRGTVRALLRGVRALPAHAQREELQRWLLAHGGASLSLMTPRPPTGHDARAALRPVFEAWATFAGAADRPLSDPHAAPPLKAALRSLVDRARQEPRALPVVLALAGPGASRRAVAVVTLALIVGLRLGLPRAALFDLALTALEVAHLPPGFDAEEAARVAARRATRGVGQTDARVLCTLWGLSADTGRGAGWPHLFGRIVSLALQAEGLLRGDDPARLLPDEAVARLQSEVGRAHDGALVEALVSSIGRYPVGSTLVLDSGEVGIVCRPPASGDQVARPVVRVVVDRAGALLGGGPVLDLAQPARARARIIATVDPVRLGLSVADAVLG